MRYDIIENDFHDKRIVADGFYLDTENVVFYKRRFFFFKKIIGIYWKPRSVREWK